MARKKESGYKVMACYDTETTNDAATASSFFMCYQLSVLRDHTVPLNTITNENVNELLEITIDRDYKDVYRRFDRLAEYGKANGIVPVVMVHNLAFDMYSLVPYINAHDYDSCSKSTSKPLTISIMEDGKPVLVFWDTLSFWGKGLGKLGNECRYPKLSGCWDYGVYRTPDTPLTDMEMAYAREDVVVPWAYMGYFTRLNPELDESRFACEILTKTSCVRYKSNKRCGGIHVTNGNGKDKTTGYMWRMNNRKQKPRSNNELELMHSVSRGGFTYCARDTAGQVFHSADGMHVLKYDANSMHICHALAHYVPSEYRPCSARKLIESFIKTSKITTKQVIARYDNPFPVKYYGVFKFENVRLKAGSVFERDGISTFASSRFAIGKLNPNEDLIEENEGGYAFNAKLEEMGYRDTASEDALFAFGKFYGAKECVLLLNEMSTWEFVQQFEFDSVEAVADGYATGKTLPASDKSLLSFNNFYKAKTEFKKLKNAYEDGTCYDMDFPDFVPEYLAAAMKEQDPEIRVDVEAFYMSVKSELNALYGIEATNEAKNKILLTDDGFIVGEYEGIDGLPDFPKAWYQYGSHIVGWSRIHQILFMQLLAGKTEHFICGDTDSHKLYTRCTDDEILAALKPLHDACDRSIEKCTRRARGRKEWYPMKGLGWYECEGEVEAFSAAWNKAYIQLHNGTVDITMAGIPCDARIHLEDGTTVNHSYNAAANWYYSHGSTFDEVASLFIGYNVFIGNTITGLNSRKAPKWGEMDERYGQPCAIYLYEMNKAIGSTMTLENHVNALYAKRNNPMVNTENVLLDWPLEQESPCLVTLDML